MKVSIITSVWNNEKKTIEDAIKSVLSQDYSDIEYIVVDEASSDGTVEAIKKYEPQISFL
jgi:glycosyltransferase